MPLAPALETVLEDLAARGPASLDLDDLADAVAPHGASYADVEEMIDALEGAGVLVERVEPGRLSEELAQVLVAARALSGELGRRPTVDEIAPRAALDPLVVRRALRFAAVLAR